jgi:DNA polymerase elongation subunit (family B)
VRAFILDAHADERRSEVVLVLKPERGGGGGRRETRRFAHRPAFLVQGPPETLREAKRRLDGVGWGERAELVLSHPLGQRDRPMLRVELPMRTFQTAARTIEAAFPGANLANVDLGAPQRFLASRALFPCGWVEAEGDDVVLSDDQWSTGYDIPLLTALTISCDIRAHGAVPTNEDGCVGVAAGYSSEVDITRPAEERVIEDLERIEGDEESVLRSLDALCSRLDPDLILTADGDSFLLHYLAARAERRGVRLRLLEGMRSRREKSYVSYGKVMYKPAPALLRGRIHVDTGASFLHDQGGLCGLVDLSRISYIPLQELARHSPGTAVSTMLQVQAYADGVAVPWKKNMPEIEKSALELLGSDRGGFTFQPPVGVHGDVWELDFASLYPNIMITHNISQESLNCDCCAGGGGEPVPGLPYYTCTKQRSLTARVLERVIARRLWYKKRKRDSPRYAACNETLKWVGVVSFGYQGYKNHRFGRIECHEAINAWARRIIVDTSSFAEARDATVLHGIVDSLWLRGKSDPAGWTPHRFAEEASRAAGIPLQVEGRYRWIVFLPCKTTTEGALNRYYGLFESGEFKLRGIEKRKHDCCGFIDRLQDEMLAELGKARGPEEFVARIPDALRAFERNARRLRDGVPLDELLIRRSPSKEVEEYVQSNMVACALKALRERRVRVPPGSFVEFVISDAGARRPEERATPKQLLREGARYDLVEYTRLAARAAETLLAPFGWSEERMVAYAGGTVQETLT